MNPSSIGQVRPSEFDAWLGARAGADPIVLDVRETWERQTSSVKAEGFRLVGLPMNEIPARLSELDPQQPVACLCHHGARSQRVAIFLAQNGFEDVVNLAGGIDAWSAERDDTVPRY